MDGSSTRSAFAPRLPEGFFGRVVGVLVIIGVALALYRVADVILLLAWSILFATTVHLISDPLHKRFGLGERTAAVLSMLVLFTALSALILFFGMEAYSQLGGLARELPRQVNSIIESISNSPFRFLLGGVDLQNGGADASAVFNGVRRAIEGTFGLFASVLIAVIGGVLLALNPGRYRDGLLLLIPHSARTRWREALNSCGFTLKGWLIGQLISMSIIAVLTSLGLYAIGLPGWLALGLLAGVSQFVPVLGTIASTIPGLVVATSFGEPMFFATLGVYVGVQQLESNFITPFVMRQMTSLPMALTLFSVLAFGALFGPLGAILATPISVIAYVLVRKLYVEGALGETLEDVRPPLQAPVEKA